MRLPKEEIARVKPLLALAEPKNSPYPYLKNAFIDHERLYVGGHDALGWVPVEGLEYPTLVDARELKSTLVKIKGEAELTLEGSKLRVRGVGGTKKNPTFIDELLTEAPNESGHRFNRFPWPAKASVKVPALDLVSFKTEDFKEALSFIRATENWETHQGYPQGTWPTVYLASRYGELLMAYRPNIESVVYKCIDAQTSLEGKLGFDPKLLSKAVACLKESQSVLSVPASRREVTLSDGITEVRVATKA